MKRFSGLKIDCSVFNLNYNIVPEFSIIWLKFGVSLFGAIIGAQGVLWAELVSALRLSKSLFGAVQLVSPLFSVVLLLAGGQLAQPLLDRGEVAPDVVELGQQAAAGRIGVEAPCCMQEFGGSRSHAPGARIYQ